MSQADEPRDIPWPSVQRIALLAGAAGLAVWALGWGLAVVSEHGEDLYRKVFFAYLFAFATCAAIPLGSMAIWMLHNQTGGAWGLVIRRVLEAATRTLPFLALLFVPLAFGLHHLYLWADPHHLPEGHVKHLVEYRSGYLNPTGFLIRAAIYFVVWSFIAWRLDRWQVILDRGWDPSLARRMQVFSGPALAVYGITVTLAAIDWLMSLEPEFFSTIYGVLVAIGQLLPAMAFAIAFSTWLWFRRPLAADPVEPEVRADLGKLLLAMVMLWAYVSFSQLLIVWSGNLHEETIWYLRRAENGWQVIAIFLAVFYFALPFALLLSRGLKRDPEKLMTVAWLLVGVSVVHHFWLITPVYASITNDVREQGMLASGTITVHWLDLAALVGVGGITFAIFLWQLQRRPLLPPHLPYAEEEVAHHA